MEGNHVQVSRGFRILLGTLAPYVAREIKNEFGDDWWKDGVISILYDDQKRDLPLSGDEENLVRSLDIHRCLLLFDLHWQNIFRKKLSVDHRNWEKELIGVRNKLAHLGGEDFSEDDTWRALDTMSRLVEQVDPLSADEIRGLLRTSRYGSVNGSTTIIESPTRPVSGLRKSAGILNIMPTSGLPSWRDVIEPHPDVAQGRYKNAEFAADLAQVARGDAMLEYQDPVEFFARTYVTEGMAGLLEQALRRVCDMDGEPVIQLKTAFGGGKTHSMLALYHLMRGRAPLDRIPSVKHIIEQMGLSTLPKVNVAVLVGTALDPSKSKRPNNMPGITINTMWGEMAAQLAVSTGKLDLYDLVKESDKKGVSPGSEVLKTLFDSAGPCLVLMDELLNYAKKLYGAKDLPAGTFDNFISFIQEVTEAARASKNSIIVASIPESEIEIGGDAGKRALDTIEHTFGRMESIWKPVAANEGFEVVRRRLFLNCKNPDGRDAVCARFSQMYKENMADFPPEAREVEYKKRMTSCYPIHPEVFDRLYEDWTTLERFQRTRGILRLMAAVIHELWMGNDASLMIMPGSIPLDVPNVRDELTRHLDDGWNALVDREIDGKNSIPYQTDQSNQRYGSKLAARRVARTIMLGSAPTVRGQNVRGVEAARIRLGVVQPGENIANFNDALSTLTTSLTNLYNTGDRFWYDTRPTLRKIAGDRATQVLNSEVEFEVENRLRKFHKEQPFAGIHVCPSSSLDVPDEQAVRLVILCPDAEHKSTNQNSRAIEVALDILNNRGNTPRIYRNMIAFIAPDQDSMSSLKQEIRNFLAWTSIKADKDDLNLDAAQNRDVDNNRNRSDHTINARIKETYCWLIVPYIDKNIDIKTIIWDINRISGGDEDIISKAAKKMIQNESVITEWAPALLLMELDNILWRESDNISIKKLWEYLCTYCYLPRLANEKVLEETIRKGLNSSEYFAFAAGFNGTLYIDLKLNKSVSDIERSGYLVKIDAAQKQLDEFANKQVESTKYAEKDTNCGSADNLVTHDDRAGSRRGGDTQSVSGSTRFFMSSELDSTRIGRDVQRLVEEVINHLISIDGSEVRISLEVSMESSVVLPQELVRTITENCKALHVKEFGFDDDRT